MKKYPKSVGACVDLLYQRRAERQALAKQLEDLKSEETELENHIFNAFGKQELRGAKGTIATASIKEDNVPTIEDWDVFFEHVKKTKSWDMLQRRLSTTAVRERWKSNKEVPGVGVFHKMSLSLTKV